MYKCIYICIIFLAPGGHFSCCFFTFTSEEQEEFSVERSELSIYVRPNVTDSRLPILELMSYRYELIDNVAQLRRTHELRRLIPVNLEGKPKEGFWERIDITSIVQGWFADHHHNMGLHIRTKHNRTRGLIVTDSAEQDFVSFFCTLFYFTRF